MDGVIADGKDEKPNTGGGTSGDGGDDELDPLG
jgi:hypothetical protein